MFRLRQKNHPNWPLTSLYVYVFTIKAHNTVSHSKYCTAKMYLIFFISLVHRKDYLGLLNLFLLLF